MTRITNSMIPYTYERMVHDLYVLQYRYPFMKLEVIGRSVLGYPIFHVLLGKGERSVHLNGSFHANEWITTNVLMQFIEEYAEGMKQSEERDGGVTLSVVPMVNPDGVNLVLNGPPLVEPYYSLVQYVNRDFDDFTGWKANIRGIDLNNQFPAYWDVEKERKIPKEPYPRDYPGEEPLTEPEVQAMAELTKRYQFDRVVALHTQGKEFYWGYLGKEPEESERIASKLTDVSSYKSVRNVDSHAGYKDWFIHEWSRPGFTLELGKGVNPLPLSQYPEIYRETRSILLATIQTK
ncbi:M14 family metallopeptidase [Priestia koreensis]|uniref:Peptidase M14 domain-containing protein n=1 Tax=Priestia koreensis TaxID=284581 RepID=A0A0M0KZ78_9BACI|nr:M14 family metallocarboxypeptidase [Priestia koreensis]KOO43927.1 hypothetical protein AMD01_14455 [Priestia koreensis]